MFYLIARVIPLDLAMLLSPGIFAVSLALLGSKNHPRSRAVAFAFGSLLTGLVVTFAGFALGLSFSGASKTLSSSIIDIVLGVIFLCLAVGTLLSKQTQSHFHDKGGRKLVKWVLLGFAFTATNADALLMCFTAAKEVNSASVNYALKILVLIVNLLFFTLPTTLPLIIHWLMPKVATRVLEKFNTLAVKYSKYLLFILLLAFGAYLIYRGLI